MLPQQQIAYKAAQQTENRDSNLPENHRNTFAEATPVYAKHGNHNVHSTREKDRGLPRCANDNKPSCHTGASHFISVQNLPPLGQAVKQNRVCIRGWLHARLFHVIHNLRTGRGGRGVK